jgi:hypothetical protein
MLLKKVNLIAPDLYQEALCSLFAENVFHTNAYMYVQVNKRDPKRVREQIYAGKMAEYAVFNFLKDKYDKVSEPDIMIYDAHKKSFSADIIVDDKHMHIKSCTYGTKYPNSWLFQPTDKITTSPSELDMLALVIVEPPKNFSCYFVKALDVLDMYENPMKEELVKLGKKMLYESTISK